MSSSVVAQRLGTVQQAGQRKKQQHNPSTSIIIVKITIAIIVNAFRKIFFFAAALLSYRKRADFHRTTFGGLQCVVRRRSQKKKQLAERQSQKEKSTQWGPRAQQEDEWRPKIDSLFAHSKDLDFKSYWKHSIMDRDGGEVQVNVQQWEIDSVRSWTALPASETMNNL